MHGWFDQALQKLGDLPRTESLLAEELEVERVVPNALERG
jgi:hypothetical protein